MKKKLIILILLVMAACPGLFAQLNVGSSSAPNTSAMLEVSGSSKGLLFPRVQLDSVNSFAPMGAHVRGMVVFNLDAKGTGANAVSANTVYVNDGTKWNPVSYSSGFSQATYTNTTISCGGALSGTYQQAVPMTSSNTKVITITVATAGTYSATTDVQNGVTFSASGTILSTGAGTQITLRASGTPTGSGTFTYTASLGGQSCQFNVTFTGAATIACGSVTQSPTYTQLVNSTNYDNVVTFTVPYTAGNNTAYGAATITGTPNAGVTLVRQAGTYAAGGGNIIYKSMGAYTGTTGSAVTFTLPDGGCSVTIGDAIYAALSVTASKNAYNAAAINDYVQITQAEYDNLTNTVTGITNFGMKAADRPLAAGTNAYISNMFSNNIPTTAIPFAFSTKNESNTGCAKLIKQVNTAGAVQEVDWNSAAGISIPSTTGTYYFVIKQPNIYMPANTNIAVHGFYNGWGATSGGSTGCDGCTSSFYSSVGSNDANTTCALASGTVGSPAPAGTFPTTFYLNYDIKWTTTKQW